MIRKTRSEEAISSVVGAILLVALTVILAAVLGQFAFDLTGMLDQPIQAGVTIQEQPKTDTVDPDDYSVRIILSSMSSADKVVVKQGGNQYPITSVGDARKLTLQEGDLITVVGVLNGRKSVIRAYTVGGSTG